MLNERNASVLSTVATVLASVEAFIGSGPNGASPHHDLSDRVIEAGEPVVVDIGGSMPDGYCSDCTRTYVAGGTAPEDFAIPTPTTTTHC